MQVDGWAASGTELVLALPAKLPSLLELTTKRTDVKFFELWAEKFTKSLNGLKWACTFLLDGEPVVTEEQPPTVESAPEFRKRDRFKAFLKRKFKKCPPETKPPTPEVAVVQCQSPQGDGMQVTSELVNRRTTEVGHTVDGTRMSLRFNEIKLILADKIHTSDVKDAFKDMSSVSLGPEIGSFKMEVWSLCKNLAVGSP